MNSNPGRQIYHKTHILTFSVLFFSFLFLLEFFCIFCNAIALSISLSLNAITHDFLANMLSMMYIYLAFDLGGNKCTADLRNSWK